MAISFIIPGCLVAGSPSAPLWRKAVRALEESGGGVDHSVTGRP